MPDPKMSVCFDVPGVPGPSVRLTDSQWALLRIPEHKRRIKLSASVEKYLAYREAVGYAGLAARTAAGHDAPWPGPVGITVIICLPAKPKRRFDISNVLKSTEDGLNGVVFVDDRQVIRASVSLGSQTYSEPRTIVAVALYPDA